MDSSSLYICEEIMKARGLPSWVLEAYEVEQAVNLAYKLSLNDLDTFEILVSRLFDLIHEQGDGMIEGENYRKRLVTQVNHRRALEELKRRSNNGDKEAAEILNKESRYEKRNSYD